MKPFGCLVTILNTLDYIEKFDDKADKGFLVGYPVNSKAFRVFNSRTRKVEENLHVNFLENKPNVAGSRPEWLFDIDSLTKSMNYESVSARNQSNGDADVNVGDKPGDVNAGDKQGDLDEISRNDDVCQGNEIRIDSNSHDVNAASPSINTASNIIDVGNLNINNIDSNHINMPTLEATGIFDCAFDDRDLGVEADTNNLLFYNLKTTSTQMETSKPLLKDEDGQEVDVHMYRSMIGSLMYLTSSRPDIMFAVCACARHQTVIANSTTEAEYVAAS
nr:ribonuclease H-like domain-containing protein [Tanacetum cinerariifolium]